MASRTTWLALAVSASVVFLAIGGCSDDDDGGGAAGEAGSAGAAGSAGQGGGAAGTGGMIIGSGGSAGAKEAGADGDTCAFNNLDFGQECNACAKQNCCDAVSKCDAKPDCVTLVKCVIACPVDPDAGTIDQACIQACATVTPVMNEYNAVPFCLGQGDCAASCPF